MKIPSALPRLRSSGGAQVVKTGVTLVVILVFATAVWLVVNSWLVGVFRKAVRKAPNAYQKAGFAVLTSIVTVLVSTISILLLLTELGVNTAPILTALGILGLVAGWGSQQLIKGLIEGFAIHKSGVLHKGDFV